MTNPPIHITPHNLTLSPALQQFIRRKMSALSRFAGDMLAAEIILRGKPGAPYPFSLSARSASGRDIQGNAAPKISITAIDQLVAKRPGYPANEKHDWPRNLARETASGC